MRDFFDKVTVSDLITTYETEPDTTGPQVGVHHKLMNLTPIGFNSTQRTYPKTV